MDVVVSGTYFITRISSTAKPLSSPPPSSLWRSPGSTGAVAGTKRPVLCELWATKAPILQPHVQFPWEQGACMV